jgi:hypothetical protein
VEVQIELVQVLEAPQRDAADGALRHLGEGGVAQLVAEGGARAADAVAGEHRRGRERHERGSASRRQRGGAGGGARRRNRQSVHRVLEQERRPDVEQLAGDEQRQRAHDPSAVVGLVLRPDVR